MMQDAIHNFSPQYQQYIHQSKISPEDERLESLRDLQVQAQQQQYYHQSEQQTALEEGDLGTIEGPFSSRTRVLGVPFTAFKPFHDEDSSTSVPFQTNTLVVDDNDNSVQNQEPVLSTKPISF